MKEREDEREKKIFQKNVSIPSKIQNLTVFSIIYMIRIRFFGSRSINSEEVSARTVLGMILDAVICVVACTSSSWSGALTCVASSLLLTAAGSPGVPLATSSSHLLFISDA